MTKECATQQNIDPDTVGTHGLRAGGAAALHEMEGGMSVKEHGNWASDCWEGYVNMNDYGAPRCINMAKSIQNNAESVEALRVMKAYANGDKKDTGEDELQSETLVTHGAEIENKLRSYVGSTWIDGAITFKLLCVSTHTLRVRVGPGKRCKRQRHVIGSYANAALYESLEEVPFNHLQWSSAKEVLGWLEEAEIGL